jgi:hypothetical protein
VEAFASARTSVTSRNHPETKRNRKTLSPMKIALLIRLPTLPARCYIHRYPDNFSGRVKKILRAVQGHADSLNKWLSSRTQTTTNVGKDTGKKNLYTL